MKKSVKVVVGGACLFVALSSGMAMAVALGGDIGMVDTHYVLQESTRVKSEKAKLEVQFKSRRDALMKLQNTLKHDVEELHKNGPVMGKGEKSALEKKVTNEQMTLQNDQMKFQKDVYEAQGKVMHALSEEMDAAIAVCAKQKGYSRVLHRSAFASVGAKDKKSELVLDYNITQCVQNKFK